MSSKVVTTVTATKPSGKQQQQRPPGQGTSRSARRRRARARSGARKVAPPGGKEVGFLKSYAATLENPFVNPPVRLGVGTLVPTEIVSSRVTTWVTSNATSGRMVLAFKTNCKNPLMTTVSNDGATPTWNNVEDSSWASINATYQAARPISGGIVITPDSSNNDKPSYVRMTQLNYVVADAPDTQLSYLDGLFPETWDGLHQSSQLTLPSGGQTTALCTWRPMDLSNFEFERDFFDNMSSLLTTPRKFPTYGPVVVVHVIGPAGMRYKVDALYHCEALVAAQSNIVSAQGPDDSAGGFFPSVEAMYRQLKPYLTPQNVVKAYNTLAVINNYTQGLAHSKTGFTFPRMKSMSEGEHKTLSAVDVLRNVDRVDMREFARLPAADQRTLRAHLTHLIDELASLTPFPTPKSGRSL